MTINESPAQSAMSIIAKVASDPTFDAAKMKEMIAMHKDMIAFEAKAKYNQAMIACQHEMQPVVKNAWNSHTKNFYVNLEALDVAIKPIYHKHGFAIVFDNPEIIGDQLKFSAQVIHGGGHVEPCSIFLANDAKGPQGGGNKTPVQGAISSMSYGKRVLKCSIFDIALIGADKDGNKPTQYITQDQCDNLQGLIEEAAGSPQRAVGLTASILRVTGARMLSEISTTLLGPAIEFAKLALERRLKGGAA